MGKPSDPASDVSTQAVKRKTRSKDSCTQLFDEKQEKHIISFKIVQIIRYMRKETCWFCYETSQLINNIESDIFFALTVFCFSKQILAGNERLLFE